MLDDGSRRRLLVSWQSGTAETGHSAPCKPESSSSSSTRGRGGRSVRSPHGPILDAVEGISSGQTTVWTNLVQPGDGRTAQNDQLKFTTLSYWQSMKLPHDGRDVLTSLSTSNKACCSILSIVTVHLCEQTCNVWFVKDLQNWLRSFICNCNCNWGTFIVPPTRRPTAHHRVNPYLGARRQNETKTFSDHDEMSLVSTWCYLPLVFCHVRMSVEIVDR